MSHIVYCWEIGADLGHITPWACIAKELVAQGHTVSCILKDLTHATRLLEPLGIRWYQAPLSLKRPSVDYPRNHADILHGQGYDSPERLHALLEGWRSLFMLLRPDRIVADAAPTAMLAARSLQISVLALDSGFFIPPVSHPMPQLRDWVPVNEQDLLRREDRTLQVINSALGRLNVPILPDFKSMFMVETRYRTWPEANHFGPHSPEKHLGPILTTSGGVAPVWPEGEGGKVFAYLKPEHPRSIETLNTVIKMGFRLQAYLPRFSHAMLDRLEATGRIKTSSDPVDLSKLGQIDFVICHSGNGLVLRCLASNLRLLLLPLHVEQARIARSIQSAGLEAEIIDKKSNITQSIHKLLQLRPSIKYRSMMQLDVTRIAQDIAGSGDVCF